MASTTTTSATFRNGRRGHHTGAGWRLRLLRTSAIRTAGVDVHGRTDTVPARTREQHQEG